MIYPENNILIKWGFQAYARFIVRRNFSHISFNTITIDKNKPVLLIANHSGFWDGFLMYNINYKLFKKKFHTMLLERTAKRLPILKYGGAFSVKKNSRDIITSLNFASQLLNDAENLVLIFPQGKLYSNFITKVEFEKGIMKVLEQAAGKFQLVYSAMFIEYFTNKKPQANIYLKHITDAEFTDIQQLQASYQLHYDDARQQQIQIVI
ncbi:MAG: 1-acyl-sn-glycerol-3-phosphate acyltransferase [Mucilaginibacter sp.]